MASFVKLLIILSWLGAITAWRNDRNGSDVGNDEGNQIVGVISLIRNDIVAFVAVK